MLLIANRIEIAVTLHAMMKKLTISTFCMTSIRESAITSRFLQESAITWGFFQESAIVVVLCTSSAIWVIILKNSMVIYYKSNTTIRYYMKTLNCRRTGHGN